MAAKKTAKKNTKSKTAAAAEFPSAFSLFGPSWEAVKLNIGTFVLLIVSAMVAVAAAVILGLLVGGLLKDTPALLYPLIALVVIAAFVFLMVVSPAMVFTQIKAAQGVKVTTDEALRMGRKFLWRFFGLSILISLIILGGLILLIVPGLFMLKRYFMAPYYLIDKDLSIGEAMKASAEAGQKYAGAIWGLIGVHLVIGLSGLIPFIGSIVNLILAVAYYCAPAVRFEQVKSAR